MAGACWCLPRVFRFFVAFAAFEEDFFEILSVEFYPLKCTFLIFSYFSQRSDSNLFQDVKDFSSCAALELLKRLASAGRDGFGGSFFFEKKERQVVFKFEVFAVDSGIGDDLGTDLT